MTWIIWFNTIFFIWGGGRWTWFRAKAQRPRRSYLKRWPRPINVGGS